MPIARGRAGPELLATVIHAKFGEHQPLNRQSERFAAEGIDLSVSTLADWVGRCTAALYPLVTLIEAHVLAAERLHGDDTTVPVLAKDKTVLARLWTYVRDDRPFGGPSPPAAIFYYSRDRRGEHPRQHLRAYSGILQADAYDGFNDLYLPGRKPGRSSRRRAGRMDGASCSCWPTWPRRRWRSRRCAGSMPSSPSSAISTDRVPNSGWRCGRNGWRRWLRSLEQWMRSERGKAVSSQRYRQSDGLHAEAMEGVHLLPR